MTFLALIFAMLLGQLTPALSGAPTLNRMGESAGTTLAGDVGTSAVGAPLSAGLIPPIQAVQGVATWYAAPAGTAAAGPALRAMLGRHWRGQWVKVSADGRSITVHLTDWCLCSKGHRVIDLNASGFAQLAPLGQGVVHVTVETIDTTPPRTDCAEEGCK